MTDTSGCATCRFTTSGVCASQTDVVGVPRRYLYAANIAPAARCIHPSCICRVEIANSRHSNA